MPAVAHEARSASYSCSGGADATPRSAAPAKHCRREPTSQFRGAPV